MGRKKQTCFEIVLIKIVLVSILIIVGYVCIMGTDIAIRLSAVSISLAAILGWLNMSLSLKLMKEEKEQKQKTRPF